MKSLFLPLMLIGLVAVTYVPSIALGPVNKVMRDKPFYEAFPEAPKQDLASAEDDPNSDEDVVGSDDRADHVISALGLPRFVIYPPSADGIRFIINLSPGCWSMLSLFFSRNQNC